MVARVRSVLAVAIVVGVVLGSLGLVTSFSATVGRTSAGPHSGARAAMAPATAPSGSTSRSTGGVAKALALEAAMRSKGISPGSVHLPNFAGAVTDTAQPIQPSYTQAPAPLGVADIGLENVSGVLTPYALNTTSVAGTVNITNLQSLYVDGDGPDTYGVQLNSVVNGVTIFGNSSNEFWSQNYVDYTVSTQQLVFGDEVWNFSSPAGYFPTSSVYGFSPNGTFDDFPFLYQGYGPTFTIGYPFALTLYLNTSTIADRPALYFNYTLSNDTFSVSSSFDYLIFNSTVGAPTSAAPTPYYQADGYDYDPIGLINDMEIDLLGNDDGDTTVFLAADATISLQYWNATAGEMQEVPSAYSAGQETGETSSGLLVYSSGGPNPIGIVRTGPGLVGGLWNYSASSGAVADTVTVNPVAQYSFLFVNVGSVENDSTAEWVPTSTTGTTTFSLPAGGTYFLDYMMSNYNPHTQVVTASGSVTLPAVHLVANPSLGVYTPLFAFDNGELAALASSGAGTSVNPYILHPAQYGTLAPEFAAWNDYLFPVFPGLLIAGTSAWADVTPPSFEIDLPSWNFAAGYVAAQGLPFTNDLQLQFYDASNISLVQGIGISGWMSAFLFGYPESSVIVWNCTDVLIASNTFDDEGNALLLYGGTNNTVWGNSFLPTTTTAADPSSVDDSAWITGVNETESGDLVYNNYFDVVIPAITPTADPFSCDQYGYCYPVAYDDSWNVSEQPASNYSIVAGQNLTGSIIGTSYQGGNYWSNYGTGINLYGALPYTDSGSITVGGDFVPLIPFTLYTVTFQQFGITGGLGWGIIYPDGTTLSTDSPTLAADFPNGTYNLDVLTPYPWTVIAAPSQFTVDGAAATVNITFAPLVPVTFVESGLFLGWSWSVTVDEPNGSVLTGGSSNGSSIVLDLPGGATPIAYSGTASADGFALTAWSTQVGTDPVTVAVVFTPTEILLFLEHGLPAGIAWSVHLQQGNYSTTITSGNASISVSTLEAGPGSLTYMVSAPGYTASPSQGSYVPGGPRTLTIDFLPINGTLRVAVSPAGASLSVSGGAVTLPPNGTVTLAMAPGVYAIEVTAAGYLPYFNNVTVTSAQTTALSVALTSIPSAPAPAVSSAAWATIGLLAALVVVLLLVTLAYRSRARRPPPRAIEPTP